MSDDMKSFRRRLCRRCMRQFARPPSELLLTVEHASVHRRTCVCSQEDMGRGRIFTRPTAEPLRKATIPQLQLLGTARWNLEKRKVTENGIVEFPNVLIHTHGMTETWNERLRCPICGSTGIASVSQRETDDTATIEDVPDRFKVVVTEHGPNFYCTICEVPAEP